MTGASFGTGDINLAAAILTMGVRPDPVEPVKLIAHEDGHDYVRFHVAGISDCGFYDTTELMNAWSNPRAFKQTYPQHPFVVVMDFIKSRPNGCNNRDQWIEHASEHLGLTVSAIRKTLAGIDSITIASPESPVSYIVAFIRNRFDLIGVAKKCEAKGRVKNFMSEGTALALIPEKRGKIRDFLISRFR